MEVKEGQFDRLVSSLLTDVSEQIQREETVFEVMNELSNSEDTLAPIKSGVRLTFDQNGLVRTDSAFSYFNQNSQQIFFSDTSMNINRDDSYRMNIRNKENLPLSQYSFDFSAEKILEGTTFRSNITAKITNRYILVEDIVEKLFRNDLDLSERITPEKINRVLSAQLNEKGINTPYEFAVRRDNGSTVFTSAEFKLGNETYVTRLFPDDLFGNTGSLVVYFPAEREFIFSSIELMAITSATLTLILIITSALTLVIIFRQKRLSEIKNDFVNNMTHELKTPISTISLASQMLNDPSIPDEKKDLNQLGKIIGDESRQLGLQVEKVLQMAIFDKGKVKFKYTELNLNALTQKIADTFKIKINKKSGRLTVLVPDEELFIKADEVHISNAISNLLDNAIKYSAERPEVEIELKRRRNYATIRVSDKGIGISKEEQKRIFERFYRVTSGNLHNVKGFGLGLSYVKFITEAHGGNVKLISETAKGSTFLLYLPLDEEKK